MTVTEPSAQEEASDRKTPVIILSEDRLPAEVVTEKEFKRRAPLLALAAGILGALFSSVAQQVMQDTFNANQIKLAIYAPKGVTAAERPGHYIFSGEGMTAYGQISNALSEKMKERLGAEGEGYGYWEAGGSFLNLLHLQSPGNERALAFAQDDILHYSGNNDLSDAQKNVTVLLRPEIYEGVFMASGRSNLYSLSDVMRQAARAAQGDRPKLVIATPSAHISGSYYTACQIRDLINSEGIDILDCTTANAAMDVAQKGEADIALFVAYPEPIKGEIYGAPGNLKDYHLHLLPADSLAYQTIFATHSAYSLIDAHTNALNSQGDHIGLLATKMVVIGRNTDTITDAATKHSTLYFQSRVMKEISSNDLKFDDSGTIALRQAPTLLMQP